MQQNNQNQSNNNPTPKPLPLASEQVQLKLFPISKACFHPKDKYSEFRRFAVKDYEGIQFYQCQTTGAEAFIYNENERFCVIAFAAKTKKPSFHYAYKTAENRIKKIEEFFKSMILIQENKRIQREKRFNFVISLAIGDVLYTSWGYEQTNIDFYQVVSILNKKIVVRKLMKDYEESSFMAGYSVPILNRFTSDEFLVSMTSENTAKIKGNCAGLLSCSVVSGVRLFTPIYESHYA